MYRCPLAWPSVFLEHSLGQSALYPRRRTPGPLRCLHLLALIRHAQCWLGCRWLHMSVHSNRQVQLTTSTADPPLSRLTSYYSSAAPRARQRSELRPSGDSSDRGVSEPPPALSPESVTLQLERYIRQVRSPFSKATSRAGAWRRKSECGRSARRTALSRYD